MEYFGLIDKLRDYCNEHNIEFIYGNDAFINALTGQIKYLPNQRILTADFNCIPVIEGSKIQSMTYAGVMALGQKCEAITRSSLDEKPIQKYDRRLKDLSQLLSLIIGQISCENELEVTNINMKFDINKTDANIDFVACSLNFVQ